MCRYASLLIVTEKRIIIMPPSSRKRNKGKDRKAKQLAKKEENERTSVHKLWTKLAKASTCNHGCGAMIPDDHPVCRRKPCPGRLQPLD